MLLFERFFVVLFVCWVAFLVCFVVVVVVVVVCDTRCYVAEMVEDNKRAFVSYYVLSEICFSSHKL